MGLNEIHLAFSKVFLSLTIEIPFFPFLDFYHAASMAVLFPFSPNGFSPPRAPIAWASLMRMSRA